MSFEPLDYVRHILVEARYLADATVDLDEARFLTDDTRKRAFVRSLEVIGEATKQLPDSFRALHPDVEWRSMAAMRDKLIHGYFGIDYELVWNVVSKKLPELRTKLEALVTDT